MLARTDSLIHGWEEALARAKEFKRIGVDAVFVEALPDRASMERCVRELDMPVFANSKSPTRETPSRHPELCLQRKTLSVDFFQVIEGGKTENLSAKDLAELGFCAVAYPWTLVAAKLKSIREALEGLKKSMTVGAPPMILSYSEVCKGVGFNKYWVRFHTHDRLAGDSPANFSIGRGREIQIHRDWAGEFDERWEVGPECKLGWQLSYLF